MRLSVFNPASPQVTDLLWVWYVCMWVCGFILLAVSVSVVCLVIRYWWRDGGEPSPTSSNTKLEIVWTAIPVLLVSFLFILSIETTHAIVRPVSRGPDIAVHAHQW